VSAPAYLKFAAPLIDDAMAAAVAETLRSGWITSGPRVADFEAALPHLTPGAAVVFDDIRWEDPFGRRDARTAEGWEVVSAHPRVRAKAELGQRYGLLLLS